MSSETPSTVHLVKGADDVLRGEAVSRLVTRLVGDGDRGLLVDEFAGNDYELGAAVDAAQTPPFLTEQRIVVIRHLGRFSKLDELAGLLAYLAAPLSTTALVLVWERPPDSTARLVAVPAKLSTAVTAAGGEIVSADAPTGKGRSGWVGERLAGAGLQVDGPARTLIAAHVGEDAGAMVGLIERLVGVYGPQARLTQPDIEPFLGAAGGVPPWELTDAIDHGDVPTAVDRLQRTLAGGRHPLALMSTLQSHFLRMLRLDGADVTSEREAADILGLKGSTFPARKALTQARRLGSKRLIRCVGLLAEADLDLRGTRAWPDELIVEVLVARLAVIARAGQR
ncbi:MAG: DNA polymerase III subunit delta [Actinomycetota bacterium]|nr:DNA polymerase III subunit delta [Actinomycetota bacterium]